MSSEPVLENWTEYDNRKIRDRRDAAFFACTESWEVDYLVRRITTAYPRFSEARVRSAITHCCQAQRAPYPRRQFVGCVLQWLDA